MISDSRKCRFSSEPASQAPFLLSFLNSKRFTHELCYFPGHLLSFRWRSTENGAKRNPIAFILFGLTRKYGFCLGLKIFMQLMILIFQFIDSIFKHLTLILKNSITLIQIQIQLLILMFQMLAKQLFLLKLFLKLSVALM